MEIILPRSRIDRTKERITITRKEFLPIDILTITKLLNDEFNDEGPYKLDGLIFQPMNDVLTIFKYLKIFSFIIFLFLSRTGLVLVSPFLNGNHLPKTPSISF